MNNNLESMKCGELRLMARDLGIKGYGSKGKDWLIPHIQEVIEAQEAKKKDGKEKIEQYVVDAVKQIIMDDETVDWIIAGYQEFIETLRGQSAILAMEKELSDTQKAIANLVRAIEMGILTDATKTRMMELEDRKSDLERSIRIENSLLQEFSADELRFLIEEYRDSNIDSRDYQKELINTFIKAVYVYDDHLKIVLNRGPGDEISIPFSDISDIDSGVDINGSCVRINDTKPH